MFPLALYFPMDELTGTALKGPHPDGAVTGGVRLVEGITGKALEFDNDGWVNLGEYE